MSSLNRTNIVFSIFVLANLLVVSFVYAIWQEKQSIEWLLFSFACIAAFQFYLYKNFEFKFHQTVIGSLIIKISLLFSAVFLSDDVYRYLWDGFVISNGINPYLYTPNAPELAELARQFPYSDLINHPYITTLYPPVSELIFYISNLFSYDLIPLKLILAGFDLGCIILLIKLAKKKYISSRLVFLFALHPLILFEVYSSAHIDIVFVFFTLLAYSCYRHIAKAKVVISTLFAAMVRPVSPLFLILTKNYRITGILLLIPVLVFTVLLSSIDASGMKAYNQTWYFNNPLHDLLRELFMSSYAQIDAWMGFTPFIKRLVMFLSLISFAFLFDFKKESFSYTILWTSLFLIVSSTTIHPWYLIILIPFAAIRKNDAIIIFTYSIFFSYHVLIDFYKTNNWSLDPLIYILEYLPFVTILFYSGVKRKTIQTKLIDN